MRPQTRVLSERTVYEGKMVTIRVEQVAEPGGLQVTREVAYHSNSVVVLALLDEGRLLLVRQYRHAARQSLWELVAGGIETGEKPLAAARRELLEETGYHARRIKKLFDFYPSPGVLTERMYLVEARGLTLRQAHPESDERIRTGVFTRRQVKSMLAAGEIKDGKTLAAIYWLLSNPSER